MKGKILVFGLIIYGVFGIFAITPKMEVSESENRRLTSKPIVTVSSFLNGSFGKEFGVYVSDHFPFRDYFVALKTYFDRVIGLKESNGVYIGDGERLMEKVNGDTKERLDLNLKYIGEFSKKYNTRLLLVPTSTYVYRESLPKYAEFIDESLVMGYVSNELKNTKVVNIIDKFGNSGDEKLFFKTDHHWTPIGAYRGYLELMEAMELSPVAFKLDDFKKITSNFLGTLYSKGNFVGIEADNIMLARNSAMKEAKVRYIDSEKEIVSGLYFDEYLLKKDKYGFFMNNNHPLCIVEGAVKNGSNIAVIKDSYANSMIPYMVNNFEKIYVIDLRHFKGNVNELLEEHKIDEVVILNGLKHLLNDDNYWRLNSENYK